MRKTLDERLTPEVTAAFNREKQLHPATIEQIMYDLSNCVYWQDLTIKTMRMLYLFSDVEPYQIDHITCWWGDDKIFIAQDDLI